MKVGCPAGGRVARTHASGTDAIGDKAGVLPVRRDRVGERDRHPKAARHHLKRLLGALAEHEQCLDLAGPYPRRLACWVRSPGHEQL